MGASSGQPSAIGNSARARHTSMMQPRLGEGLDSFLYQGVTQT